LADVLSQKEIDALLSALNNGELQASDVTKENSKVKAYDFRRAMRYSKEQLRSIMRIHENFTSLLTSYLSTQLRTFVKVEIDLVDQVNYQEFIASLPSRTILNVFNVHPMDGKMVMEMNPQVAYALLDRLLGGQGENSSYNGSLTEIETVLIRKIFAQMAQSYQEVWKNIVNMQVRSGAIESNPQFLQLSAPNDTVIIIALRTTIGETSGMITLCLPHLIVEPILPNLSSHQLLSAMSQTTGLQNEKLMKNLDTVKIPVIAELGRATLQVSDLINLQVGDVIGIETGRLQVKVGHLTRFLGNPGQQKGRYAVQIDEVIQTEGEES